jgi:hypothetical protein
MNRPSVDHLFRAHHAAVRAHVSRSFPGYCPSHADDAVAHAFGIVLERPSLLDRAWADGGLPRVVGLLRMLAWRYARGLWRKISGMTWELLPDLGSPPGQDVYVHATQTFDRALHEAANVAGPTRYAQIRSAVLDKLDTGDSDIAVAARHGIPREYVNRAKRRVTAEVLAA